MSEPPDLDPPSADRPPTWLWILPLLLGALAWGGAPSRAGFSYDDREVLTDNPVVDGTLPAWRAFDRDYWHHREDAGHWRPTATLSLRLDHARAGMEPAAYHWTNLALHLWVVLLATFALLSIGAGRAGLIGLCVFACHPALADSVAWISGRTSMLAAAGGLLGVLGVLRAGRSAAGVLAASALGLWLGLAGKEDAIVFAVVLPLVAWRAGARSLRFAALGVALGLAAWVGCRWLALGAPLPHAPGAPLAGAPLADRLAVAGRAMVEASRIVAFPVDHPPGYRVEAFAPDGADALARAVLGWVMWLTLAGYGLLRLWTGPRLTGFAALAMGLAWLPMAQLVPGGEVLAPRFLYLPLLLGAPLIGRLVSKLPGPAIGILLVGSLPLAWARAEVYASRSSYWEARLVYEADHAPTWNAVGNARMESGDLGGAADAWARGTQLDPGYSRCWVGLGRVALARGDDDLAERHLRRAVEEGPANPIAHHNLGAFYVNRGRAYEALPLLERAVALAPGAARSWRSLGFACVAARRESLELGEVEAPERYRQTGTRAFERLLELRPDDREAAQALGRLRAAD